MVIKLYGKGYSLEYAPRYRVGHDGCLNMFERSEFSAPFRSPCGPRPQVAILATVYSAALGRSRHFSPQHTGHRRRAKGKADSSPGPRPPPPWPPGAPPGLPPPLVPQGDQTAVLPTRSCVEGDVCENVLEPRSGLRRRIIGVAPWGARSSSLPRYLRLSASSRVLFLMFSSVWLGPAPPPVSHPSVSLPFLRSGRGLGLFYFRVPCKLYYGFTTLLRGRTIKHNNKFK